MKGRRPDKLSILDLAPQILACDLIYNGRYRKYLQPPLPNNPTSNKFFQGVKELHRIGHTGAGLRVGVIDSGLMPEHPTLREHLVASKNFTDSRDDIDRYGHGTLVALLILAIAPDALLVSAKALNDEGEGEPKDFIEAMGWIGKQGIQVLNISMGLPKKGSPSDCGCDICSAATRLVQNGIVVCAALGNDPISYHPASASGVMITSILGERGFPDYISERIGKKIKAPDVTVPQLVVPTLGGPYDGATSMGTAYLSGICTLIRQAALADINLNDLRKADIPKEHISGCCIDVGVKKYREGLIKEAIGWYKSALEFNPDNLMAHYNLGMAYADSGDYHLAIEELQRVSARDPGHIDAHINLGHVYNKLGEDNKATDEFKKALNLEPSSSLAMKNLAFMEFKRGNIHGAEELYKQAVMIDPNNAQIHNDLGFILEEKGKLGEALYHYEEAMRLLPYWEVPKLNHARVVRKL